MHTVGLHICCIFGTLSDLPGWSFRYDELYCLFISTGGAFVMIPPSGATNEGGRLATTSILVDE